jgi:hypothetical protein
MLTPEGETNAANPNPEGSHPKAVTHKTGLR